MDKNFVTPGIVFIAIGLFATLIPVLGLLGPGELFDMRIGPVCFLIGIIFIVYGVVSKDKTSIPQPIQAQPPQQVVKTLVICPKCGSRVSAEHKFCPECGASLMPGK